MKWEHKCSLEWLKERQRYLTASDIKALLPFTKTGRPRKITDEDRLKLYASKLVNLTENDCWSYGSAARGHMLEPFAVDAFNKEAKQFYNEKYYWWDDKVISLPGRFIAFSPDAMDIPMTDQQPATNATQILEIKSYSPEHHLLTAAKRKKDLEERWQIATAMALCPNIEGATLVLYNPSMRYEQLRWFRFSQCELEEEIEMIYEIEEDWIKFHDFSPLAINARSMKHNHLNNDSYGACTDISETDIIEAYEARQKLNP